MIIAATNVQKPKTYWNYCVYAIQDESGTKIDRSLVFSGESTLEDAISRMFADAAHYISIGYRIEIREIHEVCAACCGQGEIRKRWKKLYTDKMIKCNACKGVGTFTSLDTIKQPEFSYGLKIVST